MFKYSLVVLVISLTFLTVASLAGQGKGRIGAVMFDPYTLEGYELLDFCKQHPLAARCVEIEEKDGLEEFKLEMLNTPQKQLDGAIVIEVDREIIIE